MANKKQEEDVSIKGLWESFMQINGITPGKLPAIQEQEMRRTFYMACGLLHQKLRDQISTLPQEMAILVMETQMIEIADYLGGQAEKENQCKIIQLEKPSIIH